MKRIQTPQIRASEFLSHLYRDLRDRRLLLPALALTIALVAVPVALSSPAVTTPPPVPAATGGSQAEAATTPAVLAEQLGVTNYRKRLERLQSKNPFKRQYTAAPSAQPEASSSAAAATTSSSPVTEPSPSASTTSGPISSRPSVPPTSTAPPEPPEPTLLVFQADLAIGPPGELERRRHVELGKFLPSEAKPVVAFIGVTEDMKHALFVVSDDVSSVEGDGTCVPGPNNCDLLRLKVGKEATLAYAPEGDRNYKLRLHGIDLAPFDAKAAGKRDKRGSRGSLFAVAAQR